MRSFEAGDSTDDFSVDFNGDTREFTRNETMNNLYEIYVKVTMMEL